MRTRVGQIRQRGYVLVLTLAVLALAAISLAGLARYSLGLAASAQVASEDLQRRWGLLSLRHVMDDQRAVIIAQFAETKAGAIPWPQPSRACVEFRLGNDEWSVLLADEDAKANLNVIGRHDSKQLLAAVRRLAPHNAGRGLPVRFVSQAEECLPLRSWGQVFDLTRAPDTSNFAAELIASSQEMTCWSGERLNLRRASDNAVREIGGLVLSSQQTSELLERRKNWSGANVDELLATLELRHAQRSAASRLFTAESRHYSLWVTIANGQTTWTHLFVDDGGPVCFTW